MFKPSIDPPKDNRSPLVRFRGVLKEYVAEEKSDEKTNRKWMTVTFDFTDVEVIESTEPYPFPIAKVSLGYSEASKTRWAALAASLRKVLPQPDLDLLVGKQQEWHYAPCILRQMNDETKEWGDVEALSWQVVGVEGMTAAGASRNLVDSVLDVLDGKTESEFNSAVFSDPSLKQLPGFTELVEDIVNRTFLPMMEQSGKAARNTEGVWKKLG